jgi:hypothetical protein
VRTEDEVDARAGPPDLVRHPSKSGNDTLVQFDIDSGGLDPAPLAIVKGVTLTEADFVLTGS